MALQSFSPNCEAYFVTSTVTAWVDVFTRPVYRQIFIDSLKYCQQHKGLELYAWCLMSNHFHMIVATRHGIPLSDIMRDFKKYTSKKLSAEIMNVGESRKGWMLNLFHFRGMCHHKKIEYKFWKDNYDCFPLFSSHVFDQKLNYIHENPVRAEIVTEPHHYLYSSARNYAGMPGLLEVILA